MNLTELVQAHYNSMSESEKELAFFHMVDTLIDSEYLRINEDEIYWDSSGTRLGEKE